MKPVLVGATLLAGTAILFETARGQDKMPRRQLTLTISDDLVRHGGIVFVIPNRLSAEEFASRHAWIKKDGQPHRLTATLRDTVNFVHFDVPGRDYSYSFRLEGDWARTLSERRIGVGGAGNLYLDATGEPIFAELSLDHYISGTSLSLADAQGLQTSTGDFTIGPEHCRHDSGVRVCVPTATQIEAVIARLRRPPP